jgi:hypothetical protein
MSATTIKILVTDVWHLEFYREFIRVTVAWNYSWEGRVMKKLLDDQKRLDQLIAEALVSHLEPKAAVAEFIAFLFLQ